MEKLSVIILTFNEEDFIEEAIESVHFADEIIVMDSFSTDKTPELVKNKNVVFIQNEFKNFSDQRYLACKHVTNNMILFLDADERISKSLKDEILILLNKNEQKSAYKILFSNIFMGKQLKYGHYKDNRKIRLFNKNKCWYDESKLVHEKIIIKDGEIGNLINPIIHYNYRSWNHFIFKKNHYAELQAVQLFKKGIKPNVFHFILKPTYRFINQFVFRAGFLDGFPGFASAYINSYYVMTRYIKLWIMHHNMK